MKKTNKMATIFNGHCHIERRVYADNCGVEFVKINGDFFALDWCKDKFVSVFVW